MYFYSVSAFLSVSRRFQRRTRAGLEPVAKSRGGRVEFQTPMFSTECIKYELPVPILFDSSVRISIPKRSTG